TSLYPPRADLLETVGFDSHDVARFASVNDLDAIARATPPAALPFSASFSLPSTLPHGDYVVWVEVSKDAARTAAYSYPTPTGIGYGDYGVAYLGQPSVVWKVPFTLDDLPHTAQALDSIGYGDPLGIDGRMRDPDATIDDAADGSGARRLLLATSA